MTITSTDRKLLWARAYNSCALCKTELTGDADSAALAGIVYGEEAHIVARSIDGPRGRSGDRSAIDAYVNFILLCAKDHKRIDDQPDFFTLEKVQSIKVNHEKWAREKFNGMPAPEPIRVIRGENESEIPLDPVVTGDAVWALVAKAHSYNVRPPGDEFGVERADLADAFLNTARDWGDIRDAVEAQGLHAVREAQRSLQTLLADLWQNGLFVYGRTLPRTITGGVLPQDRLLCVDLVVLASEEVVAMQEGRSPSGFVMKQGLQGQ